MRTFFVANYRVKTNYKWSDYEYSVDLFVWKNLKFDKISK